MAAPTVETLLNLLGRSIDDPGFTALFGPYLDEINRSEFTTYCSCKPLGISIAFKKGAGLGVTGQNAQLHLVNAFHLYQAGLENYQQYEMPLPGGVHFGDHEEAVVGKLGKPSAVGGGNFSTMLKKVVPRWIRYENAGKITRFQFAASGALEMVTLFVEKV